MADEYIRWFYFRADSNQWVKTFVIKVSNDGRTFTNVQDEEFEGNSDRNTIK